MPERCPRCRGLFQTRNGAYRKHIAMCRVALDGGTGGDSSGGSEEESGSDEHRRGGGSPVPVDEQELDEEDAGAPSAAAEGAVNPQVARLRAVLEDPSANPRCLFGEAGWAVLRLWHGKWWTTSWRVSARRRCPRQATRSCPSAAPPTCGARWRAMPRSTTSALRRATSALRTVRCSRAAPRSPPLTPAPCTAAGLHQLTTRTMYVRSGVGLIG